MNAIAGLNKENLNTQGEIFKSLKSFEIIVSELEIPMNFIQKENLLL